MKARPILFNAPMVRAILNGSKTQTRRVVKDKHIDAAPPVAFFQYLREHCPYGQLGDQLWVRETFCPIYPQDPNYNGGNPIEYDYAATYKHGDRLGDSIGIKKKWTPSIYMPRAASRITLEITGIRVERLQDISEEDAQAEGVANSLHLRGGRLARENFAHLWWTINGDGSWEANPWVWVIEFRRIKP